MKILYVITLAELGGAQSVVISLANKAIQNGHDVYVASSEEGKMWDLLDQSIKKIHIKSLKRSINIGDFVVFWKLRKVYSQIKPDVIHLHSSKIGILGRLVFPSKKIIYTIHGFDSIRLSHRKFLFLEKRLQNSCKHIVTVSHYDQKNLHKEGVTQNVTVIYNGIDDYAKEEALNKQNENNKLFTVLSISRLTPPKRFDLYRDLAKSFDGKEITFFWAGNKEKVAEIPSNLKMLGEVPNAHMLLKDVNLSVLLSDFEGLPISIIESMCYGVPVIASDVGGISEILNGANGVVLKNDIHLLRNEILKFTDGTYNWQEFSINARKAYEEHFTIQQMYSGYEKLYDNIAQNK